MKKQGAQVASIPVIATIFRFEEWPLITLTWDFFTPSSAAITSISCSFADPATGGAVSFTFMIVLSMTPATHFCDDRGSTLTSRVMPCFVLLNGSFIARITGCPEAIS